MLLRSLHGNGDNNIALGYNAGINLSGDANIAIGNPGVRSESGTLSALARPELIPTPISPALAA